MGNAFGQQQQGAPPPPPSGTTNTPRWSIAIDGKTYGPYTDDVLRAMVQSGQVAASTQAWRPGAARWAPHRDVPGARRRKRDAAAPATASEMT